MQFDKDKSGKGSAVSAAKAKVPVHPSYEVVVKGKAIGTVKGLKISDFFKDFFDAEGTEPKSYTRKVQTKMPRFKIGEGSSQIAKPTKKKTTTS